jgi:two-component system, OmpR family, phosphate regulon sensor histidine kinase PhoR
MAKRRLMWQVFLSYLIVIVLAISAVTLYMTASMKKLYLEETASDLKARALLLRTRISPVDISDFKMQIDSLCKSLGKESGTRFTVILPSGIVIGDTDDDPAKMEDHSNRPEIIKALSGQTGVSTRYSHTLFENMMYVAIPISDNGEIAGVVRSALPVTAIDNAFGKIYPEIILGGLIIAFIAVILSFYITRRISNPLEKMRQVAVHFSKGEFDKRVPAGKSIEIDELASAMNQMASELDNKIKSIVNQRNELDTVLSSMVEGVLTVDISERLVSFNQAASQMLGLDINSARGRYIQEAVRFTELQKLVAGVLENREPREDEIELEGGQIMQIHGTILRDDKGNSLGVLVVLNDITRLRHLEKVRRDFVANVSHELRTPITSIKGFVETLKDGALDNPDDAKRFIDIISRQADRLSAIVTDLLALSQLEETDKVEIRFDKINLKKILLEAISTCESKAIAKNIKIDITCDNDLEVIANPPLFEQAVINLLDNAIKYSSPEARIEISAIKAQNEISISIKDWGPGIEKRHLSRLFERFYTANKARSRELGGTGLGLSIVKHIILTHHGDISVESAPGKGSVFTIHLPI